MVVGDSMSQGREGDWTWRYRIWDWFRQNDVAVRFIGPYKGTVEPEVAPNPRQANYDNSGDESSCGPKASGGYARGVNPDFESEHFALWGRAAAVSREEVGDVVKKHPTDLMLVMLGFNDMGWFYSDWEGTLESIGILINNARGANPDLKFAIANVPHRSFLSGREDLVSNTNLYNSRLPHLLSEKSTESSPVHLVDVAKHYSCGLGGCPAGKF